MAISDATVGFSHDDITAQLPRFLAALSQDSAEDLAADSASRPESVRAPESFQVWTVALGVFRETGAAAASWNGVWHHQIRGSEGPAVMYARSWTGGSDVEEVQAVFRSALAEEIHHAMVAIDADEALDDDNVIIRLLEIPDIFLSTVWIARAEGNEYIPLGTYASQGSAHFARISESDLRARLPEVPIVGIRND